MKTFVSLATAALLGGSASAYDVQVQGHSGQFTLIGSYADTGNNYTVAKIRLAGVREVDADGETVGNTGSTKHSLNSFASQDFEYTTPDGGEFVNISGVAAQRIAVDTPVSTIGRVGIDTYLFLESGNVTSEAGDEWWLVEEGDLKFNIFVSEWEFCNPCGSGNNEGYGESLEFDIEIKTGGAADSEDDDSEGTTTTPGKATDAAEDTVEVDDVEIHLSGTVIIDGEAADTEPLVYTQGSKTVLTIPIPNFSVDAVYDPVLSAAPRNENLNGAGLATAAATALAAAAVAAAL